MSEQDGTQSSTKQRRSRNTSTANQQNSKQVPAAKRPANDNKETWRAYWKEQGQPWRTEPEIDEERQKYLAERRSITPDIEQGIYPFKDIKLSRADVEWLLTTHESKGLRGPVDWSDETQRQRNGLDLRGVDLSQENLSDLPLTRIFCWITLQEWERIKKDPSRISPVLMRDVNLFNTHLEGADLRAAHLERSYLHNAHLERAQLRGAHLEGANLRVAQLQGATLFSTHLEGADLTSAHLEGASLYGAHLDGANLTGAILSDEEYGPTLLADVRWGEINLAVVDWTPIKMLGDEQLAHLKLTKDVKVKDRISRIEEYQRAVRANRQLGVVLRDQGLNEVADRFAYRAQVLQRKVFWKQKKNGQYLFSLFLALLAGYGYKPWRAFLAYLLVITAFATAYLVLGQTVGPSLSPLGSFVFSMTSFHGRGFFPGGIALDDPLTVLAALEAFVGLLIEVTFIATLTQRLFSK